MKLRKNMKKSNYVYCYINPRLSFESYIKENKIQNYSEEKSNTCTIISRINTIFASQAKNGCCLIGVKMIQTDIMNQIICILNKYYDEVKVTIAQFTGFFNCKLFISCKNFKGISDTDFNKLLNLQKKLFEYDNTGGILTSNNGENITSLFDMKGYEDKIDSVYDYEYKKAKLCNETAIKIMNAYNQMSNKEKVFLHQEVINMQYQYGIEKCNELGIPLNPVLIEYIRKKEETNSPRLFDIDLYNVKKVQKYKATIKDDETIDSMIARRELDIEEGSLDADQIKFFQDIFMKNKWIKNIGEIGFNVGISADTFLSKVPFSNVTSFDIVVHEYVYDAKEFIDKKYPNRHLLIGEILIIQYHIFIVDFQILNLI